MITAPVLQYASAVAAPELVWIALVHFTKGWVLIGAYVRRLLTRRQSIGWCLAAIPITIANPKSRQTFA
jgi:hypothetical protein